MQALMMTDFHRLQLVEQAEPELARPDDVLIEVRAAGVCGSDLHGYTGQTGRRTPPLIMGHEVAGVVLATGPGVESVAVGDRVAINPIDRSGPKRRLMGMDAPGGFAERVVWPAANLVPLPDEIGFPAGSLAEPLAVAVHAIDRAALADVEVAAVVGAGPIGLLVAGLLMHRGVPCVAITDLSDERLAVARRLGCAAAINPIEEDPREAIRLLTGGSGADLTFEAVGAGATVAQAHALSRDGGTVTWIGNNARMIELDMQEVVTRELDIRGTYGMVADDFARAIDLLRAGAVDTGLLINRLARLEEGPSLFDELLASPSVIKCVFELAGAEGASR
jgi:L-iditol 2-dehydrogenase